ncbi:hypothetical protein EYR36_010702 [Pleurotus pulmonarius]|nr:hypothetical protein EYR36_010702 [Pleurotus pulmonarius]
MALISVRRAHLPRQTPDSSGDESPSSPQPTDSATASPSTVQPPTESPTTTVQVSSSIDESSAMASSASNSLPRLTVRQDSTTPTSAGPSDPTGGVESTSPPTSIPSSPSSSEQPPTTSSSPETSSVPPTDPPSSQPTLPPSTTPTSESTAPPTSTPESTSFPPQSTSEPPPTSDSSPSTSSDPPQTSQPTPSDPSTVSPTPTSSDNGFIPTSSTPESVFTTEIATTVDGQLTTITSTLPTSLWSPAPSSTRATPSLIAGVSVGAAVLALIIIGGIFAYRRNHRKRVIFGFVEKLVAKRKHQQNRARLLEGEDFGDEDVEDVAMAPYRDRDGAHSRLSSVTGGMPIEVHSRGMSASGALGDFGVLGGRDSPASTLSAPGTSSPSLFRARAESGSLFREEGVWPPPGEESRIVDPFARGMGAGESLLPSPTSYAGITSSATRSPSPLGATTSSSPNAVAISANAAASSSTAAPASSTPATKGPFAFITNLARRTETPPPAYRSSPLSNADAGSSTPLLTPTPPPAPAPVPASAPALPPASHSPSLSALIAATEIPMQTSILSSQTMLPNAPPVEPNTPPALGPSSTGLPPGAAAPRAPGAMSTSPTPETLSFNPDDMALPSSPSPTYLSASPPSPTQAPQTPRMNRLSNISSGSFNADGSPKNWLERTVHPRR